MNINKTTLALLLIAASATSAFATAPPETLKGFNKTKNVTTDYQNGCTSTTAGTMNCWAAASGHSAGDKDYATTSAFGGLGYVSVTPGATVTAPSAPNTPTDSACPANYTSM